MKQRRINATLKRALPPIAALALTTLLILTALPRAGTAAPTVASLSTNPKRINESAEAHSFIRSPFVDSSPGTPTRISAAPRLERQPLGSLTALNSTEATERGAPLSAFNAASAVSATAAADAQNVELVGQIGGPSWSVAVQGDYAYLGVGPRLVVLDVSDPANPTVVGQTEVLPSVVLGVAVAGNYAYVTAAWNGLRIINVTDPAAPTEAGYYDTPGYYAYGVAVAGNYAYVADYDAGLRIINVTDPAAPTEAGYCATPYAYGVAVAGNYAYVAADYAGLHIINVSNPAAPSLAGSYDTPGFARGVAVAGNYAYVTDGDLRIINVTDPAAPSLAGFYDTPGTTRGVAVAGNYAYVADWGGGLRIINVTDPVAPSEAGSYDTGGAWDVAVAGNYAYVADFYAGLRIINVTDPAAPTEAGSYDTPGYYAYGVAVAGNYAYVAAHWAGLHIINVTDPAAPSLAGFYDTPGIAYDVAVAGNYAYVADQDSFWDRGSLRIINVTDPAAPSQAGFYDTPRSARGVAVAGNYAYVVDYWACLYIINVTDPAAPTEAGFYATPGIAYDVAVAGNYAYVAAYEAGLRIINVTDPAAPTEAGFYDTPGLATGVAVAGNYAYVADGYGGGDLRIINVTDPAAPTEAGFYDTPGGAWGVAVAGNYAYVADGDVRIINATDPAAPTEAGFYNTPGGATGVAVAGNYAYVADGDGGLFILRFTGGPPTPFLDLPFEYTNFGETTLANKGGRGPGRVNAWFDHTYPNYGRNYNLTLWNGRIYTGAGQTYDDCLSYGTCYDGHNGIDFSYADPQPNEPGNQPLPIRSAAGGAISETVTACTDSCRYGSCLACGAYGNYVIVNHRNHYFTRYAHLREVYVSEGQSVTTDDTLGIMGATGHVEGRGDGTHLHLSVYYDDNDDGTWSENEVVDPFHWRGSPPEPWEAQGGPTSYYLWIHQVSTQDPVSGDQGATMTDTTGHIQAIIPPGAFSGQAILELSPVPEAEPSAQLRSIGRSFWLRLLEWLLEGGGLQSATTLQNTTQFTLTKPITLTVTYTDTDVLHLDVTQLALHRWDEEQGTWQPMTTTVDSDNHVVTAQTEDLGDFDLQAPLLCATDDLEPDDGYAAARWVWPNDWPLARGLDIPQDSDWSRFDAVQGARYTVRTQNLAGGADTVLNLYDVDALTLLANNDDADGGPASELVWTAPYTGTFFVETVSAPGGTTDCSATYELTIATIPGDVIADCQVDIADIMEVASRWRLSAANPDPDDDPTTPNYETRFDLDRDGDTDIVDIMLVVVHWGETC